MRQYFTDARRLAPIGLALAIIVAGFFLFVQPLVSSALAARAEAKGLEERVAGLQRQLSGQGVSPVDHAAALREFERLVPAEDKVPQVVELLARLALDPQHPDEARALVIDAGQPVRVGSEAVPGAPQVAGEPAAAEVDPRFALFPAALQYTPVTVSLEATHERVGRLLWGLRDLPTIVEIHALEMTRALPLAKTTLVLFVFQRVDSAAVPPAPHGAGPRVATGQPAGAAAVRGLS